MKRFIEQQYEAYLKDVIKSLGHKNVTDNFELDKLGKKLFGAQFIGVFARDEMPRNHGDKLFIVNQSKRSSGGTHWLAISGDLVYDSFGRNLGFGMKRTEKDAEQDVLEDNCGQRCMAWLCVAYVYKNKLAKLV